MLFSSIIYINRVLSLLDAHRVQASERTRAVASFFRDASVSSTDSVMVVVALALDTPRLTPLVTAWERAPFEPEPAPDEVRRPNHAGLLGISCL